MSEGERKRERGGDGEGGQRTGVCNKEGGPPVIPEGGSIAARLSKNQSLIMFWLNARSIITEHLLKWNLVAPSPNIYHKKYSNSFHKMFSATHPT